MAERSIDGKAVKGRQQPTASVWLLRHLHSLVFTFGQIVRSPLNTLLTAAVIGIALALPASLFVLLDNVKTLTDRWEGAAQLSLYLVENLPKQATDKLLADIEQMNEIERVRLITPAQALEEYQQLTGFDDLGAALGDDNPLPAVVVLYLGKHHATNTGVRALVERFSARTEIQLVQSDLRWLERLRSIIAVVHRGIGVVAALFGLGVLLIVGNTIRMAVQSRREEIEITLLVGATGAFIRRPFLYSGLWYGLLGSLLAWLLVASAVELLAGPVLELATLYHSEFRLRGPGPAPVAALLTAGATLGLIGSWLAVSLQLRGLRLSDSP